MAPKKQTKESQASFKLIAINKQLHDVLDDILQGKQEQQAKGTSLIPFDSVSSAYMSGKNALDILSTVNPGDATMMPIMYLAASTKHFLNNFEVEEDKLILPKVASKHVSESIVASIEEEASKLGIQEKTEGIIDSLKNSLTDLPSSFIFNLVNNLANQIHDAGMSLIKTTGTLQGCSVSDLLPDEASAISQYCSGVLPFTKAKVYTAPIDEKTLDKKVFVINYPQIVEHKLGLHWTKVSTLSHDEDIKTAIEYRDSAASYPDSKNRFQGVQDLLEKEGFACSPHYPHLYCNGDIEKNKLSILATFFSLLLNGDISESVTPNKPEVISEKVWDMAGQLTQKWGGEVWQSDQGQLNWKNVYNQWKEDKLYQNKIVYEDLRNLILLRDKHHYLIEEAYNVEAVAAPNLVVESLEGVSKIVKNAQEAIAIFDKNKWPYGSLKSNVAALEKAIKAGQKHDLMPTVDTIGNTMHYSAANVISQQPVYGGCQTQNASISNINSGNLAYCEGILKGESGKFHSPGNTIFHNVPPNSFTSFIMDENPDGGYNVTFTLPSSEKWTDDLKNFLKKSHKFTCTDDECKAYIMSLDDIRHLSLFISNLRGVSDQLGEKCAQKAIELSDEAAKLQNQKGVYSFSQEPIKLNEQSWVSTCKKQYGILPKDITEKEKEFLNLVGSEKVYGGCDFNNTDTIPNEGVLKYCEGIRKNPESNQSAFLNDDGTLNQFYHGIKDQIAIVSITPLGPNSYQIEMSNIDLMKDDVTQEVKNRLSEMDLKCDASSCSGKLHSDNIRFVAAFLSSVHQIHKVNDDCVKPAVQYAFNKVYYLPDSLAAHEEMAYPWMKEDWNKEVCSKIVPGEVVETAPPEYKVPFEKKPFVKTTPSLPDAMEWDGIDDTPHAPFKYHGCTSLISAKPTEIKKGYCQGVHGIYKIDDEIKAMSYPNMYPGTAATLASKENIHYLGADTPVIFSSKWSTLWITLPDELAAIQPIANALMKHPFNMSFVVNKTFKKQTSPMSTWRISRFLSHLSGIQHLPEWCHQAAVNWALQMIEKNTQYIYPYDTKDWEKEVCGKIEVSGITPPLGLYENLTEDKQNEVQDAISKLIASGSNIGSTYAQIKQHFGLGDSEDLRVQVTHEWEENEHALKEKGKFATIPFKWLGPFETYQYDGHWSVPKAHMVALINQGWASYEHVINKLTDSQYWAGKLPLPVHVAEELLSGYMEKLEVKDSTQEDFALEFLKDKAPLQFTVKGVHEEYIYAGLPVTDELDLAAMGNSLEKLAKEGKINSYQKDPDKPSYFWYPTPDLVKIGSTWIDKPWVEATKTIIANALNAGTPLDKVIENAYSPTWQNEVSWPEFKEWAKEVFLEHEVSKLPSKDISLEVVDIYQVPLSKLALVNSKIVDLHKQGVSYSDIANLVSTQFNIELNQNILDWVPKIISTQVKEPPVAEVAKAIEEIEEEKPPDLEDIELMFEKIANLIKMGWSKEGVTNFYSDKTDPAKLTTKVNKLFKLYEPEHKVKVDFHSLNKPVQEHVKNKAWAYLNKGKTIHDIAWYLSKNYSIDKESLLPIVRELSQKPLKQVAHMVELIEKTEVGQKIGGCTVEDELTNLKPTIVSYCQGAYSEDGFKAGIYDGGTSVSHSTPSKIIDVQEDGNGGEFNLSLYTESNSFLINKELVDIMGKLGFNCAKSPNLICNLTGENGESMSIANQDKVRKAALLLTAIDGIEQLDDSCVPKALQYAYEKAKQNNKTSKPWTIPPYPHKKEDWQKVLEC